MNVSFKRDMTHNYMVPEIAESVPEEDYRVRMLLENHIGGLLPCSIKRVNCQSQFFYDITSRQSMEHVYGGRRMSAEDIRVLLRGLHHVLREIKKYLLDMDMIVLEPQMIYMDIETREPLFCYLPGYQKDMVKSFREFTAYLLEHLDQTDHQAVLLGYEVYRKAREENYSLEKVLQEAGRPQETGRLQEVGRPQEAGRPQGAERSQETRRSQEAGRSQETGRLQMGNLSGFRKDMYPDDRRYGMEYGSGKKDARRVTGEPAGNTGEPDEKHSFKDSGKKQKVANGKKGKQKRNTSKEKQRKNKAGKKTAGRVFLVVSFVAAVLLLLAAAWFWKLNITQTGGIIFLLAAIFAYGFSAGDKEKDKNKKEDTRLKKAMEDFEEEPYYEEEVESRRREEMKYTPNLRRQKEMGHAPKLHRREEAEYASEPYRRTEADHTAKLRQREQPLHFAENIKYETEKEPASTYGKVRSSDRFGDTGVLYEVSDDAPRLVLVSMDPREKDSIVLERDSYIVGKLPSQCDIVLNHPSVSRVHAKLERLGNDYYLCDMNSTNGTYLNGKRLMVNECVKIRPADEIAFARMGYHVAQY